MSGRARAATRCRVAYLAGESGLGGGEVLLFEHLTHRDRRAFEAIVVTGGEGLLARRARERGAAVFVHDFREWSSWFGRHGRRSAERPA